MVTMKEEKEGEKRRMKGLEWMAIRKDKGWGDEEGRKRKGIIIRKEER